MDDIEVDWEALHALDEQTKQGNPGAAVLALFYRQAATRAITTALVPWDGQEEWTEHIQKADEDMQVAMTLVRQHAYAVRLGRGQVLGQPFRMAPEELKDDVHLTVIGKEVHFRFPLWMFCGRRPKHTYFPYKRQFPYIYDRQFWDGLIEAMIRRYDEPVLSQPAGAGQILRQSHHMPYAEICFVVKGPIAAVRDADRLNWTSVINALVQNGILRQDNPSRLSLSISWESAALLANSAVEMVVRPMQARR